jgi:myosin heavy subunit
MYLIFFILGNPFFVKCIKPNTTKTPGKIDKGLITTQLRYSGMLETIKVRKQGYPCREFLSTFISRYWIIHPSVKKEENPKEAVKTILRTSKIVTDLFQIGDSKIFYKNTVEQHLESIRTEKLMFFAKKIQALFRMLIAKREFKIKKDAAIKIEALLRGALGRKKAKKTKRSYIFLQAVWRGRKTRKLYEAEFNKAKEIKRLAEEKRLREEEEERERQRKEMEEEMERERQNEELISYLEKTEEERQKKLQKRKSHSVAKETTPSDLQKIISQNKIIFTDPFVKVPFIQYKKLNDINKKSSQDTLHFNEVEDIGLSWQKFTAIYFREESKPYFQKKVIKNSLLKLPEEASILACKCYRAILKLVLDDCNMEIILHCINYICDIVRSMENSKEILAGNLKYTDEIICQVIKMTVQNPTSYYF